MVTSHYPYASFVWLFGRVVYMVLAAAFYECGEILYPKPAIIG